MTDPYNAGSFSITISLGSCYSSISDTTSNGQFSSNSLQILITNTCPISTTSPKAYTGNTLTITISDYYLKFDNFLPQVQNI